MAVFILTSVTAIPKSKKYNKDNIWRVQGLQIQIILYCSYFYIILDDIRFFCWATFKKYNQKINTDIQITNSRNLLFLFLFPIIKQIKQRFSN